MSEAGRSEAGRSEAETVIVRMVLTDEKIQKIYLKPIVDNIYNT